MLRSAGPWRLWPPEMGAVRASAWWRCCSWRCWQRRCTTAAGAEIDLGGPRHRRSLQPALRSSGSRRRDGTWLGFRHYAASGPATGRAAIVVHGSSGSSGGTIHALSQALAARGVETFAVDIRGHGTSGTRGDIGYVGQLEDDLADFVAVVAQDRAVGAADAGRPFLRRRLCAARGGLADPEPVRAHRDARALSRLRRALHPAEFRAAGRTPIFRASSGCSALREIGITCCEALPVLAFAVPPNSEKNSGVDLYRPADAQLRGAAATSAAISPRRQRPLTIISGADDELMFADKYAEAVRGARSRSTSS